MEAALESGCPFLKDKIDVQRVTDTFSSRAMGLEFQVHFFGIEAQLSLYEMVTS